MNRLARVSSTVLVTGAALWGCTDAPTYNGGAKLQPVKFVDKANTAVQGDLAAAATRYVRSTDELTSYDDDWKVRTTYNGNGSSHVRLDQVHNGIPVWGADIVVHTKGDRFDFVAGNRMANLPGFDVEADIEKDVALATAKADYNSKLKIPRTQLAYSREATRLVIVPTAGGGEARLAWHVVFFTEHQGGIEPGLWNYFVDAKTGYVINKFNAIHSIIHQASGPGGNAKVPRTWTNALDVKKTSAGDYVMDTTRLQTFNMNNQTSNGVLVTGPLDNIGDAAINDAHGFAEGVLNMMDEWQGFNSIDNQGFVIKSRVHYSVQYENAFWDGEQMTYGDGRDTFYPLSGDIDVVGHEVNHGFTSFHSNLIYQSQSGGLNESFSDIAGTVAEFYLEGDSADFDIGRDVFKADAALRFACDPTADGISIDHFNDFAEQDVHYTSGISNKAFCYTARRLATGGTTGNATTASVRRASLAWYRANAAFWTTGTTFQQGCQGTLDAARDLGFTTEEQDAIRQSWVDVGVYCDGEVEPLICDTTLTTDHGEVTSPNFPSEYPSNYKHTTCIIPASGSAATLHFTNFDTESGFDFVVLKDATGATLSTTSGTTPPADVTSTTIVIKFNSDVIINRPGWRATW